ncbi:hypothetical protein SGL43_07417 [Streptomyces globisporus]|uniref:Uncharacterized protein n=1 Tax=Streptomyces globisporus TaxID=1908 RepID=A0ABM9H9K8_STRGL|nr:hypothetical protein SGL43_07417 [Streptomyces globisporus]
MGFKPTTTGARPCGTPRPEGGRIARENHRRPSGSCLDPDASPRSWG